MGASRTRHLVTHRLRAGVAVTALGLALASAAAGPAPARTTAPAPREAAVKGAPGVVVQYEESAGSHVLYLQEKGGLVTSIPPPVADPRQDREKAEEPAKPRPAPPAPVARRP